MDKIARIVNRAPIIQQAVAQLLCAIEAPAGVTGLQMREGLQETPERVAKAFATWFGGYDVDIPALFKTFEDGAEGCDELVIVRDIPVYSHCEHHMAPIIGRAVVGYVPGDRIIGLSKLSRVVDAFSRRLQVQERLTNQIADAIAEHLRPQAVFVYIDAKHMCMESRGVKQVCGSSTITRAVRLPQKGDMKRQEIIWRSEFAQACN